MFVITRQLLLQFSTLWVVFDSIILDLVGTLGGILSTFQNTREQQQNKINEKLYEK